MRWRLLAAVLALLAALALALALWHRPSLAVVVTGDRARWGPFLAGVRAVAPGAQLVLLPDPEVDQTAYCDALQECADRFRSLVCQVLCPRASEILAGYRGRAVTVASPPELASRAVVCNVMTSEQAAADALLKAVPVAPARGLALTASGLRLPAGWTQVRTERGLVEHAAAASGQRPDALLVTVPVDAAAAAALSAAHPTAPLLVASSGPAPLDAADGQVADDPARAGRLAAALLAGTYRGPRDVVVEPETVKPARALRPAGVTLLSQLGAV